MYKIEKRNFGFYLTFGGYMLIQELEKWYEESYKLLRSAPSKFGIFIDMRSLKPLPPDGHSKMKEGQKHYKKKGMIRSVVILDNAITTMQFKRIAKESGIYEWERYIDASAHSNWEKIGLDWLEKGADPDA